MLQIVAHSRGKDLRYLEVLVNEAIVSEPGPRLNIRKDVFS